MRRKGQIALPVLPAVCEVGRSLAIGLSLILIRRIPQTETRPRQRKNGRYAATGGDRPARFREQAHQTRIHAHGGAVLGERSVLAPRFQERTLAVPVTVSWNRAAAETLQILWQQILRAVNDPQILGATTFDCRLRQAASPSYNEFQRLIDHPLAATTCKLLPPTSREKHLFWQNSAHLRMGWWQRRQTLTGASRVRGSLDLLLTQEGSQS